MLCRRRVPTPFHAHKATMMKDSEDESKSKNKNEAAAAAAVTTTRERGPPPPPYFYPYPPYAPAVNGKVRIVRYSVKLVCE
jgi:hypothetical protein